MYRKCGYCQKDMGQVAPIADESETTGICPDCLKKELAKIPNQQPAWIRKIGDFLEALTGEA